MTAINVAATLRGELMVAMKSTRQEKTQREKARAWGTVYGLVKALATLHNAGQAEPGIDWRQVVGLPDQSLVKGVIEYVGEQMATEGLGPRERWEVDL